MAKFAGILLSAVLLEAVISYISMIKEDGKISWKIIVSMLGGILVAFAFGLDFFALLGIVPAVLFLSWVGTVMTGIIISRGSNYVFELIKRIMDGGAKSE